MNYNGARRGDRTDKEGWEIVTVYKCGFGLFARKKKPKRCH